MTWKEPKYEAGAVHIALPGSRTLTLACNIVALVPSIEKFESQDAWFTEAWGAEGIVYRICFAFDVGKEGRIGFTVR